MPDDLKNTGKGDDIKINIHKAHEVQYWTKKFVCTRLQLENAVEAVGPMAKDVKVWLSKNIRHE